MRVTVRSCNECNRPIPDGEPGAFVNVQWAENSRLHRPIEYSGHDFCSRKHLVQYFQKRGKK